MHYIDALPAASPEEQFSRRVQRALAEAEDALHLARSALAAGDADAANAALGRASEAHDIAQSLRRQRKAA